MQALIDGRHVVVAKSFDDHEQHKGASQNGILNLDFKPEQAIQSAGPKTVSLLSSFVHGADLGKQRRRCDMQVDVSELDRLQEAYKAAVEEWIGAIRQEEALASVNHSVAEIDQWELAHFREDDLRSKVKDAKKQYEDALRAKFFNF